MNGYLKHEERISGTWIYFGKLDIPNRKTEVWQVISKQRGTMLGDIRWFGPWRSYAFFPETETVFEEKCLEEISEFLKELKKKRLKNKQRERTNGQILDVLQRQ